VGIRIVLIWPLSKEIDKHNIYLKIQKNKGLMVRENVFLFDLFYRYFKNKYNCNYTGD